MVKRYAEGETLHEIGERFGVSRERVRQITVKHGADAESARAARVAVKNAERGAEETAFLATYEDTARILAERGLTRSDVVSRLVTLYPHLDPDFADETLRASTIVFDQDNQESLFTSASLKAGIWFLVGSELGLKPDPAWAAIHLEQELLDELGPHLTDASVTRTEYATILGVIGATQRRAQDDETLTITGKHYESLRLELLDAMGIASVKGAKPWPPTRQTIMKRFGGWNDALIEMGLATASKGRSKGMLAFTPDDYAAAVAAFVADCERTSVPTTFANYEAWVLSRRAEGERRPSGASIRNLYGTWMAALRAVHARRDSEVHSR